MIRAFARSWLTGFLGVLLLAPGWLPGAAPAALVLPAPKAPATTPVPPAAGELVVKRATTAPIVDGRVDAAWAGAQPLRVPLTWGMRGARHALDVELRALRTSQAIYFLARWHDAAPSGPTDATANRLTLHWSIDTPASSPPPACDVACHTAYSSGAGRLAYMHAETIPPGNDAALPAAGGWQDGAWTLEWGRPLVNSNPYDLQFTDLSRGYSFFLKVFERVEDRPDPVSATYRLVFRPSDAGPAAASTRPAGGK